MNYSEEEKEAIENAKEVLKFTTYLADIGHKDLEILLNLIQKQDKIINAMKYRVVLTEKEHRMILKMLERRSNKRYEDCVVEYFKKVVDEDVKD